MRESNALRNVCKEFREAVMDFPWMDAESVIKGSIEAWRAAFPAARAVNVKAGYGGRRKPIVDSDFVHIRGDARARLHTVNMFNCWQITDAAFVHLRGIQSLVMAYCDQIVITDAAFVNLRGIQVLIMDGCNQVTITDAAFVHLRGVRLLSMNHCNQVTITDAAFVHLRGIQSLYIEYCRQATITGEAIANLVGIDKLYTRRCTREVRVTVAKLLSDSVLESGSDSEDGGYEDNDSMGDMRMAA